MIKKYSWAIIRRIFWSLAFFVNLFNLNLAAKDYLYLRGISLSRKTPKTDLEKLISSLRPKKTDLELIRIGSKSDGGYLLPDDFEGLTKCFSAGCDQTWHFEKHLDASFGIKSIILDSLDKRPSDLGMNQTYVPFWLGASNSSNFITFDKWFNDNYDEDDNELILQMDIEGAEYEILNDLKEELLDKFRIIVIEFHDLANLKNKKLFNSLYYPAFQKLFKSYEVVHVHANNCCGLWTEGTLNFPRVIEVTLLSKKVNFSTSDFSPTPHPLDIDCVPTRAPIFIDWPS